MKCHNVNSVSEPQISAVFMNNTKLHLRCYVCAYCQHSVFKYLLTPPMTEESYSFFFLKYNALQEAVSSLQR